MGANQNLIRGRVGFINRIYYNKFVEKNPSTTITYEQYISVLKQSTILIRDFILGNELGFKLPFNLGYIAVDKYKCSKNYVAVDWVNTRKLGRIIPLTNFHSLGYGFKVKLFKNSRIKPFQGYAMNAHRVIKRMLAKNIKEGTHNYIAINKSVYSKRFAIDHYLTKKNKHNG